MNLTTPSQPAQPTVWQNSLSQVCKAMNWPYAEIWLPDESDSTRLVFYSASDLDGKMATWIRVATGDLTFRKGEDLPGRGWQSTSPFWSDTLSAQPQRSEVLREAGLGFAGVVPVDAGVALFFVVSRPDTNIDSLQLIKTMLEQSLALATTQKEKQQYAGLFTHNHDAVFLSDLDGNYLAVNQRAADMLGYEIAEIVGQHYSDYIIPIERIASHVSYRTLMAGKQLPIYERNIRRKDNSILPTEINVALVFDEDGNPLHIQSIVRDISGRKQAEAEIRQQATRAQSLVKVVNLLNVQRDLEAIVQTICRETALVLNVPIVTISLYDAQAKSLYHVGGVGLPPEYPTQIQPLPHAIYEAFVSPQTNLVYTADVMELTELPNAELYVRMGLRTTLNVSMMQENQLVGRLNIGTVGEVREFILEEIALVRGLAAQAALAINNAQLFEAVQKELGERQRAERTVKRLNEELEERIVERTSQLATVNKELEAFAYTVSHDLRAPLRALKNYSQFLQEDYDSQLAGLGQEYLAGILECANQMDQLVVDLLAYSRVGRVREAISEVQVGDLLNRLIPRLGLPSDMVVELPEDAPTVLAQPLRLEQIFANLVGNGAKFQRSGVAPKVTITWDVTSEKWYFTVADNGIGIDPKYFAKIFGIFQRLHTNEEYEGTGIGLAIVKKAVEEQGGEIWVDSVPGRGSAFTFTIPKSRKKQEIIHHE